MGAQEFFAVGHGTTAKKAFRDAVEEALYECGHAGYTGTIAEKGIFVTIDLPEGVGSPEDYASKLVSDRDSRVSDKWGPAGCIKIKDGEYLFFGWASC